MQKVIFVLGLFVMLNGYRCIFICHWVLKTINQGTCSMIALKAFFQEVLISTAVFVIIALAAVGLGFLIDYLISIGADLWTIYVLETVHKVMLIGDAIMYLRFLFVSFRKLWKKLGD